MTKFSYEIRGEDKPKGLSYEQVKEEAGVYKPITDDETYSGYLIVLEQHNTYPAIIFVGDAEVQQAHDIIWENYEFRKVNKDVKIILE